jgi:hypothetical protein
MLAAIGYLSSGRERSNIKDADEDRPTEAREPDRQRPGSGMSMFDVPGKCKWQLQLQ